MEDLAGTHGAVEAVVVGRVQEDEVGGAVVELVAVEMMAVLPGLTRTPERRADKDVNITIFTSNPYLRISPMTFGRILSTKRA